MTFVKRKTKNPPKHLFSYRMEYLAHGMSVIEQKRQCRVMREREREKKSAGRGGSISSKMQPKKSGKAPS